MPIGKTVKYTMDRRQLLKLTGAMGIGATFLDPETIFAADPANCEKIKIDDSGSKFEQTQGSIYYWIDGNNFGHRTNVKSRANISVFITLKQKDSAFVESVVLIDQTGRVLGARYLDASIKMVRGGFPPYIRFENIEIDPKKVYKVIYSVKDGFQTSLYVTALSPKELPTGRTASENSALNESINWLPNKMRSDFSYFLIEGPNAPSKTPGLFTTPFQFYTDNGLDAHCSRGVIKEISSDGKFKINVEFMHGDSGGTHFMRYFVIMDPVGRILGFHKRYRSTTNNTIRNATPNDAAGFVEVVNIESDQSLCWNEDPLLKEKDLPANLRGTNLEASVPIDDMRRGDPSFMKKKIDHYNIKDPNAASASDNIQIADIRDCPYIQIYTEDSFDAMARSIIRLR